MSEIRADINERIVKDECPADDEISDVDTKHETVNHSSEEWVPGDVHTSGMEGIWPLFTTRS